LGDIQKILKDNLPPYMVPAYIEYLPVIPMTSSDKADRKNLPPPTGQRVAADTEYFAPQTPTQELLAGAIGEVLKLDKVSIRDDFFKDLGAHSMLMAQFGSKLRKIETLPGISMRDIYLNPTVEKLAAHMDTLGGNGAATHGSEAGRRKDIPVAARKYNKAHIPARRDYYICGALQLATMFAFVILGLWVFVTGFEWTYEVRNDNGALYARAVMFSAATFLFYCIMPIAAKWLLIGRWQPQKIPVWSLAYYRFWLVKGFIQYSPMAAFIGTPLYNLYLRLLGARIGTGTVISSKVVPVCTDLISIGNNCVVGRDSVFPGYTVQGNIIHTGPVNIGNDAFVGDASILDVETSIGDGGQLGHVSSLQSGQTIPAGTNMHGSPAEPTDADYCKIERLHCSELRRWSYTLCLFALSFFVSAPLAVIVFYWFLPIATSYVSAGQGLADAPDLGFIKLATTLAPVTLLLFVIGLVLGLVFVASLPRLLNRFLEPGKVYVLYGFHNLIHNIISATSNSAIFNLLFGDSSLIVHYLKAIGYDLGKVVQTGANFGLDQRHDNPFLCKIGSGTMVSDGLTMMNMQMSNSSFSLNRVRIGEKNYVGNTIYLPHDSRAGNNCLLATKVLVPIEGPMLENVGLLGSPSFQIPRITKRDKDAAAEIDDAKRQKQLRAKLRYNIGTMVLFLAINWFYGLVMLVLMFAAARAYLQTGFSAAVHFTI
ncbi:MAG TPA: peptide synthetase, partial [Rhizobiales bacterium]|nr:peptide synthetase [Hyphomicrobiales bacterium]